MNTINNNFQILCSIGILLNYDNSTISTNKPQKMKFKSLLLIIIAITAFSCEQVAEPNSILENPKYKANEAAFIKTISSPADSVQVFISQEIHTSVLGKTNSRKLNLVFKAYSNASEAEEFFNKKADLIKTQAKEEIKNIDQYDAIDLLMKNSTQVIAQKTIYLENKK